MMRVMCNSKKLLAVMASLFFSGSSMAQVAEITPLALAPQQVEVDVSEAQQANKPKNTSLVENSGLVNPNAEASPDVDVKAILEMALKTEGDGERYLQLSSLVKAHGPWIPLQSGAEFAKIHIVSYLLQIGNERDAVALLKRRDVAGWLSYSFMGGVANDFLFAIEAGQMEYIAALCLVYPEGVNTPFVVAQDGGTVLPLSILASGKYKSKPYYEPAVRTLLKHGANPVQSMPNGLTPLTIASSESNSNFLRIVQAFQSENEGRDVGLLENTPLTSVQMVEQQRITDALLEMSIEERKNTYGFSKLHEMWLQMIMKGFNVPAKLLYDTLISFEEFNVDKKNDLGMNGLMAASMSELYGGNVDYAKILIGLGAKANQVIEMKPENVAEKPIKANLIQIALPRDNFKIVALLITNGVDFVVSPDVVDVKEADTEDALILTEATRLQAYRSAYVIWQALKEHLDRLDRDKKTDPTK